MKNKIPGSPEPGAVFIESKMTLVPVYDVHYKNQLTHGVWHRWMSAPKRDIEECRAWIRDYNKPASVGGMVHFSREEGLKTTFRIVKMNREILESSERQD